MSLSENPFPKQTNAEVDTIVYLLRHTTTPYQQDIDSVINHLGLVRFVHERHYAQDILDFRNRATWYHGLPKEAGVLVWSHLLVGLDRTKLGLDTTHQGLLVHDIDITTDEQTGQALLAGRRVTRFIIPPQFLYRINMMESARGWIESNGFMTFVDEFNDFNDQEKLELRRVAAGRTPHRRDESVYLRAPIDEPSNIPVVKISVSLESGLSSRVLSNQAGSEPQIIRHLSVRPFSASSWGPKPTVGQRASRILRAFFL